MDAMADIRTLITLAGIVGSAAVAWGIAKTQIRILTAELERLRGIVAKQFDKTDDTATRLNVVESKVLSMSEVMSPSTLMAWTREDAMFKASTAERLAFLERTYDR